MRLAEIVGMGKTGSKIFTWRITGKCLKLLNHVRLVEVTAFVSKSRKGGLLIISENMQCPLKADCPRELFGVGSNVFGEYTVELLGA